VTSVERVVTRKRASEQDEPWRDWTTRPVEERIEAVEDLRREHHGWAYATEPRLPRVLAIVRRARDRADAADLPPAE
jgi:hypothetical protein